MKSKWKVFLMAALLMTIGLAPAGVIVPTFDDSTALGQYTVARNGAVINEVADITTGKITFAARFNPNVSQATAGPVIVIETGGTTNGTGLYLANGNLIFVSKGNGRYAIPTSLSDTDFSAGTGGKSIAVDLGAVNFGAENKIYVSMDLIGGLLFASINGTTSSFTITGSTGSENLDGNRTVSFLGVAPIPTAPDNLYGWLGGLLEQDATNQASTLYPQLFWTNAVPMIQNEGYNNQLGQVFASYIPEPATLALLALGGMFCRMKKRK